MNSINTKTQYLQRIRHDLDQGIRHTKKSIEKIALSFGIADKTQVKEFTELAIVLKARVLAHLGESIPDHYFRIVRLYKDQVTLSHRTSQSMVLPQYITPAAIAFMAGIEKGMSVLEPSARNGDGCYGLCGRALVRKDQRKPWPCAAKCEKKEEMIGV